MHPIDQRRPFCLELLGGGDIGRDHELLDQPMGVETGRGDDVADAALLVEQDLPLGQIEVEGRALVARPGEACISPP